MRKLYIRRDENGIGLTRRKKKRLLSFLLNPFLITALIIVAEVGVLAYLWWAVGSFVANYVFGFHTIVVLIFSLVIINSKMESSSKLTWVFFTALFAYVSIFFFILMHVGGYKLIRKNLRVQYEKNKDLHPQNEEVVQKITKEDEISGQLCNYLYETHHYPVYQNTSITYFPLGEDKFDALLIDLENAKEFIFMEYFIIEEGYMWGKILEILERKVKEGVEVRVLYDGTCSMNKVPVGYFYRLRSLGIYSKVFNPIRPLFSSTLNYRDHRKILVIDNKIAYNGGVNLADEYINRVIHFGHWKDTAVRLEGEAVSRFTTMFLSAWFSDFSVGMSFEKYIQHISSVEAKGYVIPYATSPLEHEKIAEMVYFDIINQAKDYVYITTPYLILDDELIAALRMAAMKGVDVRIIIPGVPDKYMVWCLAKTYYARLKEAGVRIYEYSPGFIHAKNFVSDDKKAVVGTINLDYRSLYHHFECGTYMVGCDAVMDIKNDFLETMNKSHEITIEDIKNNKWYRKLLGLLMKLVAPIL